MREQSWRQRRRRRGRVCLLNQRKACFNLCNSNSKFSFKLEIKIESEIKMDTDQWRREWGEKRTSQARKRQASSASCSPRANGNTAMSMARLAKGRCKWSLTQATRHFLLREPCFNKLGCRPLLLLLFVSGSKFELKNGCHCYQYSHLV